MDSPAGVKSEAPQRAPRAGAWRRLTGADEIARLGALLATKSAEQQAASRRSRTARELAERAGDGLDATQHDASPHVLELYVEAVYWALLARQPDPERPSNEALWQESESILGNDSDQLDELRQAFVSPRPFVDFVELPAQRRHALINQFRTLVERLHTAEDAPVVALQFRLAKRVLVYAGLAVAAIVVAVVAATTVSTKPDLARGKPWTTSSTRAVCHPEKTECAGARTSIFFHTNEEANPWFEYDLGAPTQFSSLTIRNRTDDGGDRAVPLIVEVSDDHANYREIAQRTKEFRTWTPRFAPQRARYVRLRAPRTTFLHLEQVQVHP